MILLRFHRKVVACTFFALLLRANVDAFNVFRPGSKPKLDARIHRNRVPKVVGRQPPPPPPQPDDNDFAPQNFWKLPELPLDPEAEPPSAFHPLTTPPPSDAWTSLAGSALSLASKLAPRDARRNSERAARIEINQIPPQSIRVDLSDVPIVGPALSGTFARVQTAPSPPSSLSKKPSVVIASPKDKWGAVQEAAETGNLEFGLRGMLASSLDVKLEPNQPGVAPVQIKSPLIPKWPFGKRRSDWNKVTNMGNGDVYYFNTRTGATQYEEPRDL